MKAIVTVVGKDRVGIIASVCTKLAEYNVNVLDISQTVMQLFYHDDGHGYFPVRHPCGRAVPADGGHRPGDGAVHPCSAGRYFPGYAPGLRTCHAESK